jgi:hypothetical protein
MFTKNQKQCPGEVVVVVVVEERGDGGIARWRKTERKERKRRERESPPPFSSPSPPYLARAALAVGVAGVFIETHPDPDHAPSDGPNMIPLAAMPALLDRLQAFDALSKRMPEPPLG